MINTHGVECCRVRELFGNIAVSPDHAAPIAFYSNDPAMLLVSYPVFVRQFLDAEQILGSLVLFGHALDLFYVAWPGSLFQFIE